jgi:transposase InsO family protein
MKRAPRDAEPGKRWLAFLRNHQEVITAMDFFTVPTIRFGMLYCFFVIAHDRRRVLRCNVTKHPTSLWVVQQLREAFPFGSAPRFLIFDRHRKYGVEVLAAVRSLGIEAMQTSFQSLWQNGVAERWIESCRREPLDHIIAVNERHLRRLLFDYVRYHHEDRTHLGLGKGTPAGALFLTIDSVDCIEINSQDAVLQPLASDEGALIWSTWSTDGDLGVPTTASD